MDRIIGLGPFETPAFLDRLRMGQQGGIMARTFVNSDVDLGRTVLTQGGFLASGLVISPMMAGLVPVAGVPALVAQLAMARRRAAMMSEIAPAQRRGIIYARLLNSVEAAKGVRLLGYSWSGLRPREKSKRSLPGRRMIVPAWRVGKGL
ncbi:hypothetical protein ACIBP6_42145 [Nonomuraea terrae]|uniref:hypothetical protein n=1 Tax=Nonomuraea terrae TaxID=2530383 RepID=UPI0037B91836